MMTSVFSTFLELLLFAEEDVRERFGRVGGCVDEEDGGISGSLLLVQITSRIRSSSREVVKMLVDYADQSCCLCTCSVEECMRAANR